MIDGYIALHARLRPSWPAVILPNRQVSFAKFDEDIDRACWELDGIEVAPDEAVSVVVKHPYLHWVAIMALARHGIASAPSNAVGCRLRLGDPHVAGTTAQLTWDKKRVEQILRGRPCKWHTEMRDRSKIGRMIQTSGTTGNAKRIATPWYQIDASTFIFATLGTEGPWYAATGTTSALGYHTLLSCWWLGNPAIMGPHGPLDGDFLKRLRPRVMTVVPSQLKQLVDSLPPDFQPAPLRIISSGGFIPSTLARRIRSSLTSDVRSLFGSTECNAVAIAELAQLEAGENVGGYLMPQVEIEIVDEAGKAVPFGESGRLRVRSDRVPDSYVGNEELSSSVLRDGWFDTGDLVRLSLDGLLTVDGRADDLMNIAGHKVLPGWIEQAALGCDGVEDAGAFSVPDEAGLERCMVALVLGEGFSEPALTQAMRKQISWLHSIGWFAVDSLPRNQMGKIERAELRRLAMARKTGTPPLAGEQTPQGELDPLELSSGDILADS